MKVRSTALPAASDNEREGGIGEEKAGRDRPRCSRGRSRRVTNARHARKNSLGCGIKLGIRIKYPGKYPAAQALQPRATEPARYVPR